MTREEIMAMEVGREMDKLVANKIMGLPIGWTHAKLYSSDISAAWEVVEKLVYCYIDHSAPELGIDVEFFIGDNGDRNVATASTAPLAICRAALLAVMEGDQKYHDP